MPDGQVSLKRNGILVSTPDSEGWSIENRMSSGRGKTQDALTKLDNMKKLGPNKILLWSSEGPFEVKVAISGKGRYFKFELLHVSNDMNTGGLNKDWPGHSVKFDIRTDRQDKSWQLNSLMLNPMSQFIRNTPYWNDSGTTFFWPYPEWAQTTDRPQPQGAIAIFDFASDAEHDDILTDIWASEPSLPRPNRANLKSWTRSDVDSWMNRWVDEMSQPIRSFSIEPQDAQNLYKMVDIAEKNGINMIKLHNFLWQGDSVGLPHREFFPNGVEDVIKFREYCHARGVKIKLHGFGGVYLATDKKYGRTVIPDGIVRSARGNLGQRF